MAATAIRSPLDLTDADSPTSHALRSVQEEFAVLPGEDCPLVAHFGYGEAVIMDEAYRHQVIVDKLAPQTITMTTGIDNSTTTLTFSTTNAILLAEGQVLLIEDELILVATTGATTVAVERDFAGSTAAAHTTGATVHILSPLYLTDANFSDMQRNFWRGEFKNFELFHTGWQLRVADAATGVRSYLTKRQDPFSFDRPRQQVAATQQLERLMVYSKAQQMTDTQIGAPAGLDALITTNVTDCSSTVLTATDLVDTLDLINAHDPAIREWTVMGNRKAKRIWDAVLNQYFDRRGEPNTTSVGVTLDSFHTNYGDLHFMIVPSLKDDDLFIVKKDDFKIKPLDMQTGVGNGWVEVHQDAKVLGARLEAHSYSFMGFLVLGDERKHGKIHSFTTSGSSYAGYV